MKNNKKFLKIILLVLLLVVCYSGYVYSQPIPPQQPAGGGGGGGGGAGAPIGEGLIYLLIAGITYGTIMISRIKTKLLSVRYQDTRIKMIWVVIFITNSFSVIQKR